tara:strand:+ start:462 stop:758 length:297 start_codon:yes stop_codon:yes gene_type:complete
LCFLLRAFRAPHVEELYLLVNTDPYNSDKNTTRTRSPVSPPLRKVSTKPIIPPSASTGVSKRIPAKTKKIIAAFTTLVKPSNALLNIESHEAMLFLLD